MSGSLSTKNPRDADVLRALGRAVAGGIHTLSVGTIVEYDASKSPARATVRLVPCSRRRAADGSDECFRVPPITNCPVVFPGAGSAWADTWPLAPGDTVAVMFAERSMSEWLETGSDTTEPADPRRHDYADAFVLPAMLHVASSAEPGMHDAAARVVYGDAIKLGSAAASQAVALQPQIDTDGATLKAALQTAASAAGSVGSPAQWAAFATTLASALLTWPNAAGASKVKAE